MHLDACLDACQGFTRDLQSIWQAKRKLLQVYHYSTLLVKKLHRVVDTALITLCIHVGVTLMTHQDTQDKLKLGIILHVDSAQASVVKFERRFSAEARIEDCV